jgi:hypothetical protein
VVVQDYRAAEDLQQVAGRAAAGRSDGAGLWGLAAAGLAFGCAALWLWLAWARLDAVHHRTYDLALYARMAWGLAHGEPWVTVVGAHAAILHSAWILWPLGLLGRFLGTVPVLLVSQVLAVAGATWVFVSVHPATCWGRPRGCCSPT